MKATHVLKVSLLYNSIRIEKQDILAFGLMDCEVVAFGESQIL